MAKCIRDYTVINSQPSIEALENLITEIFWAYGLCNSAEDIFYYGVFCKPQNYINFEFDGDYDFEVPSELTSACTTYSDKINFIQKTIKQIMRHEIEKPEWMKYVEMNMDCNEYGMPPSTFLQIEAKDPAYEKFAERLIEFLYSPNLTITMVKA